MRGESIADLIAQLNAAVESIERGLRRSELSVTDLADLKQTVDDARLRLWALMIKPAGMEATGFEERFRIRRARELCGRLADDLAAGRIPTDGPEFAALAATTRSLARAVERAEPAD
jgi:hypothetical protein